MKFKRHIINSTYVAIWRMEHNRQVFDREHNVLRHDYFTLTRGSKYP